MFQNAQRFISQCDACRRRGNISKRHEMPQNLYKVEVFYFWGIDFKGPFPTFHRNKCILVDVDYMFKSVEAIASPKNVVL